MTIKSALNLWAKIKPASSSPMLDAELLLAHVLKKPREFLYTYSEKKLTPTQYNNFKKLIAKRAKYWPVAYLVGHKEFYGLDFIVTPDVLIPRPETEQIVDLAAGLCTGGVIADIGTGCGNIAIALAKKLPSSKIIATDISAKALAIAKKNAKKNNVAIEFHQGSMLDALPKKYKGKIDLIVSNPPYLPKTQSCKKTLRHEPQIALTPPTGKNPNYWINQLISQAPKYLKPCGRLIYEGRDGKIFK